MHNTEEVFEYYLLNLNTTYFEYNYFDYYLLKS